MSFGSEMHVKDFLSPRHVLTDLRASDKTGVLQELARRASAALNIPVETISGELLRREQLGSTGMGNGIAIPHARIAGVKSPFGMLARLKQPVEFEAVDGQPVDLVFLLLVPASSQGEQLNVLACVSRRLRDREVLDALRGAKDSRALYRRMTTDTKRF
jgi:PTS system nitrogen regulatory IIA component